MIPLPHPEAASRLALSPGEVVVIDPPSFAKQTEAVHYRYSCVGCSVEWSGVADNPSVGIEPICEYCAWQLAHDQSVERGIDHWLRSCRCGHRSKHADQTEAEAAARAHADGITRSLANIREWRKS